MSDDGAMLETLAGRTITRVKWFEESEGDSGCGTERAWLWLDDGRVIEFGSWGHDWWGATVDEITVGDVAGCLTCGKSHSDLQMFNGEAFCPDHRNGSASSPHSPRGV